MLVQPALGTEIIFFLFVSLSLLLFFRPVFSNFKNLWLFVFSGAFFLLDIILLGKAFLEEIPLFSGHVW